MLKIIVACVLWSLSIAQAQTYVQINGISWHDQSGYNDANYGVGLEQGITDRISVAGGWYYNSEYRVSTYAYGRYTVYRQDQWDFGIAIGAVTGYQRAQVVPMAFPEACYVWACALFVPRVEPTGANVVGLRLRIPIK
jgi:hypothetical protein